MENEIQKNIETGEVEAIEGREIAIESTSFVFSALTKIVDKVKSFSTKTQPSANKNGPPIGHISNKARPVGYTRFMARR